MSSAAPALPGRTFGAGSGTDAGMDPRKLVGFIAMVFGMFMAILDTQIVSASLTDIQAGLAASNDEISWVQTAYLVAEVIAIPLSGFLSRALGTRILFAASAAGFTAASFMCGTTSSINEMIAWRALQGFIGGGMIPTVFASTYLIFPASRQPIITPLVGLVATLAPTVGPTIGGYITEALSWHWLFFINVLPGVLVTIAVLLLVDFDRPDPKLFRWLDWIGLLAMAGFLGTLEYVLEEGPRYDWLDDPIIALLAVVSGLSAAAFFARVLTARNPIVDLRAFSDRNFALGSLFSFVFGVDRGKLRTYRIHLGSSNILMQPNDQYLCIVLDHQNAGARVRLPFEGDHTLTPILSKAFLLAEDDKDRSIVSQLKRP